MGLMTGKRGVIFGVSNTHGIAYGIAKQLFEAGAEIAFTYAGEVMEKRVRPIAEGMNAKVIMSCDVTKEEMEKEEKREMEKPQYDSLQVAKDISESDELSDMMNLCQDIFGRILVRLFFFAKIFRKLHSCHVKHFVHGRNSRRQGARFQGRFG